MPKEKKGLGIGLDALFGNDEEDESLLVNVPIAKVEPREDQPRSYFDEEALRQLADSIEKYGLIQPITARKLDNGYYQIIAGERRWRASRLAGLTEVPVRVLNVDDRTTAEMALVENLQRQDLNPIEEAEGYKTLIEDYGLTQEQTAQSVGKSRPAVTNALRLLNLSEPVRELVANRELSAGHARALVVLENGERQLEAAKEIIAKSYSVRKAEALAARLQKEKKEPEKTEKGIDYAKEVSDELTKLLGRRVVLTDGRKTGRIEIDFYGADDRERLIEAVKKLGKE